MTRTRSRLRRLVALTVIASTTLLSSGGVAVAADYTQNVTPVNATQAQIAFAPTTPALYVDVHYISPNAGQQNHRMTNSGGTWQHTVGSLTAGFVLDYWFTYEKSGPQFDTPHFSYTHSGTGSTVATPTFSPAGGTYANAQSVTLATSTASATIRYTLDGSTPTASSTLYSGPITISASTTVRAIGLRSGMTDSPVATAAYVIGTPVATPTFSPAGGTYANAQAVTLATSTASATIRYTLD
ncbi:MAG: chitobiase/beta-hexosaminidase C-terminal domain-containing protein, partial [Kibdelosporangium sp.]